MVKHTIECPKCHEVFRVDEAGYAAIVKQIRDKEFSKELCKLLYDENAEEASWNSDEALIQILRDEIIYPQW